MVLTTRNLASSDFAQNDVLHVVAVEDIENLEYSASGDVGPKILNDNLTDTFSRKSANGILDNSANSAHSTEEIAVIVLTSGNTGLSKAICPTHTQIFASLKAMMTYMPLPSGSALLNWTPLDQ